MKKAVSLLFVCVMLFACASITASASELDAVYVNTNYTNATAPAALSEKIGNDSNAGTQDAPVESISKALELVKEGGTIYITGGMPSRTNVNTAVTKPVTIEGLENNYVTFQCPLPTAQGTVTYKNLHFYQANIFSGTKGVDYDSLDLVVDGCTFTSKGNAGMNITQPINSLTVQNCKFNADNVTGYAGQYIVWPYYARTITIKNNEFNGGDYIRGAIHLGEGHTDGTTAVVENNTITGYERGIQVAPLNQMGITLNDNDFSSISHKVGSSKGENEYGSVFVHEQVLPEVITEMTITKNTYTDCANIIYSEAKTTDVVTDLKITFTENTIDGAAVTQEELTQYVAYRGVAEVNGVSYQTLQDAVKAVADGDEIVLISDVALEKTLQINNNISFTINGNGYKITNAGTTSTAAFQIGSSADTEIPTDSDCTYTIKNIVFDGWTTAHVVRCQGIRVAVDGCTFQNCNQTKGTGLLTLTYCDAEVTNCIFKDNTCLRCIDVNFNAEYTEGTINVSKCTFENNNCTSWAVILQIYGDVTVDGCAFTENTVKANSSGEGTVVFMAGYPESKKTITNNTFTNNAVTSEIDTGSATGAIIVGLGSTVSGNTYSGNTANGVEINDDIVASVGGLYYGTLQAAVDAAADGDTVTLQGDATGAGVVINKDITIDFGGYTYTVNKAVGSTGTETLAFQILAGSGAVPYDVTLKNGKIAVVETPVEGKQLKVVIMNYSNLTLEDMILDGTDSSAMLYGLSTNNGDTVLTGATSILVNDGVCGLDVDGSRSSYGEVAITVNTTGTVQGTVAVYGEEATATVTGGTFTQDVSEYVPYGYSVVNGTVTEGSGETASVWTTDTDAGSYVDGGTTYGMMRFLFAADVEGEVTSSGIMYISGNDTTKQVGDRVTGTSNAFYGDIVGIAEGTEGSYYAVAYITTAEGTVWSAPLPCTIDWAKQFTAYEGGNE